MPAFLWRPGYLRCDARSAVILTFVLNSEAVSSEPRVAAFERRTQWPLAVLAILFLVAWAWPILRPTMSDANRALCETTNIVIWVVFGVEFLTRIYLAEHRGGYVWRHVPDVLMLALPVLRPLRLVRLLVLMRMINRRATASLRGRVAAYVVASAGLVLLCASLAVLEAERHNPDANIKSFSDAVWWAAATMTTVGYGDRYPTTTSGRAVGFGLMLAGIALLGVVTASIASWLIDRVREVDQAEHAATRSDIDALRRQIAEWQQTMAAQMSEKPHLTREDA
jgi:voltage-gated potassium channel